MLLSPGRKERRGSTESLILFQKRVSVDSPSDAMHLRVKLDFSSAEPEIEFILRPELPSTMYTSRGAAIAIRTFEKFPFTQVTHTITRE